MNKKLNYESIILIVLIFLLILYVTKKVIKDNNEGFQSDENSKLNDILDNMIQRNDGAKKEEIFDSVDKSIEKSMQKQSTLRFENGSGNTSLMDKYIFENIILSDEHNPNPILESRSHFELPSDNDTSEKYNHELRQINITKQIKQDYIIKVLHHKIDLILNSLKPVQEIKTDIESLKHPDNKYLVDILKNK